MYIYIVVIIIINNKLVFTHLFLNSFNYEFKFIEKHSNSYSNYYNKLFVMWNWFKIMCLIGFIGIFNFVHIYSTIYASVFKLNNSFFIISVIKCNI